MDRSEVVGGGLNISSNISIRCNVLKNLLLLEISKYTTPLKCIKNAIKCSKNYLSDDNSRNLFIHFRN